MAVRILAAPHQDQKDKDRGRLGGGKAIHDASLGVESIDVVDSAYLRAKDGWQFPPLESDSTITKQRYMGPTPESNWVIPGKLLVGAYPCSNDDTETFELLTGILKCGVDTFVCLQLEYPSTTVTEVEWRSGQALRPYYEDAKLIVQNKQRCVITYHNNVMLYYMVIL